jgi:hypothetical protein
MIYKIFYTIAKAFCDAWFDKLQEQQKFIMGDYNAVSDDYKARTDAMRDRFKRGLYPKNGNDSQSPGTPSTEQQKTTSGDNGSGQ